MDLPRIAPMLATPGTLPPAAQDAEWAYETKQDGQRAVFYLPGDGTLALRSRSGEDITAAYPELRPLAGALPAGLAAVLDGEIVMPDEAGRSDFARLQPRMGLAASRNAPAGWPPARPSTRCCSTSSTCGAACSPACPGPSGGRSWKPWAWQAPPGPRPPRSSATARRRCAPPGSTALRASSARGSPPVTHPVRAPATGSRSATCGPPTSSSAAGCPARDGSPVCPARCSWASTSGPAGTSATSAPSARAGASGSAPSWPACSTPRRRPRARSPRAPPVAATAHWVRPRLVGEVRYATRTRGGLLRQPSWLRLRPDLSPEESSAYLD